MATVLFIATRDVDAGTRPLGTDVSSFQGGSIPWTTVKNDGVYFAWTKATEATDYIDADFTINESNAKAAGVLIGAYHFARPSDHPNVTGANSADSEASYFWSEAGNYVAAGGSYLVPMLDWEDPYVTNNSSLTETTMSEWANEWCNDVSNYARAKGLTAKPVIYTGTWYSEPGTYPGLNSSVTVWPSWLAAYPYGTSGHAGDPNPEGDNPGSTYPWGTWNCWQYGDTNWSGGDSDVFNGTTNQFDALFVVTGVAAPANVSLYFDPGAKKAAPGSGGRGNWDSSTSDWWYAGNSNVVWSSSGDSAIFGGSGAVVAVNTTLNVNSMTFLTNGYGLNGNANTLSLASPALISVPSSYSNSINPLSINCIMSSGSGCSITGGGTVYFNNTNSLVGTSVINSNSVAEISASTAWGARAGMIVLSNNATFQNDDQTSGDVFLASGFGIILGAGGGNLRVATNGNLTFGGVISGSGSLGKKGMGGTLTLSAASTYTGGTTVNQGTLAIAKTGSIGSTTNIAISAGAIFDVSANSTYSFPSGAMLTASGTSSAAAIKGSNSISIPSQSLILNYDGSHPALTVSAGSLALGSNAFVVNGSKLVGGSYTLIQQTTGNITLPGANAVSGSALSNSVASVSAVGGGVILTVSNLTAVALNVPATSTYPQSVTFTATVTPIPSGGSVQFYDEGIALASPVTLTNGSASFGTNALAVGSHSITATFSGSGYYRGSTTTGASALQIILPPNNSPITIGSPVILGSGAVQMNFSGEPGYTYLVEATTNLDAPILWNILSTNIADTNGDFTFTDYTATNFSGEFYRTMVQTNQ